MSHRFALRALAATGLVLAAGAAFGAMELNLPEPVSPATKDIFELHMLTASVGAVIMAIVTAVVVYALWKFRKSTGYEADQNFHRGWFGKWAWLVVPIVVLGIDLSIAGKATQTFDLIESYDEPDLTLKITGSQWKWTYDYMDDGVTVVSNLKKLEPTDELYLRDVDNPIVLPVGKRIRLLHTAKDVLHSWWVPQLAGKKDAIPGYINETWTKIEKEGTYRGQCAENCGTGHAFMPIVVQAVSPEKFEEWIAGKKLEVAQAAAEAASNKEWTLDELKERGQKVYATNCVACHQATGEGIPNVFPALKGSKIATGDRAAHLDIVIHGSKKNPVMVAWGKQLNDLELASVITYERNAWGNDTGDVVQPSDIKAAR